MSLEQASALAACLPPGSLCLAAEDERAGWTRQEMLSLMLVNSWREKPYDPFEKKDAGLSMEMDEYAEYLSRPRAAV